MSDTNSFIKPHNENSGKVDMFGIHKAATELIGNLNLNLVVKYNQANMTVRWMTCAKDVLTLKIRETDDGLLEETFYLRLSFTESEQKLGVPIRRYLDGVQVPLSPEESENAKKICEYIPNGLKESIYNYESVILRIKKAKVFVYNDKNNKNKYYSPER